MKRMLGLAAAAIVASGALAAAVPATAAETSSAGLATSTTASTTTVAATPSIVTATPAAAGDLHTGDTLRLFVTIDETSGSGVIGGTASVSVDRNPITSRSALAGWFAGTSKTVTAPTVVTTASSPVVAAGITQTMTIAVPASSLHLGSPGVYAVNVNVRVGGSSIGTSRTAVAWNLANAKAVPVAVAVPLTVPASSATLLDAKTLALDTAQGGVLTKELDDLTGTQFAIGIDPRIIASIRILGKSAPTSAIDWLVQLEALPNETFPLAWADSDIAAGLQAGEKTVLGTKPLDYAIDPDLFRSVGDQAATPSATPTSDPTDPTLPTSASLTAYNYTMQALSWPQENSLTDDDIPKIAASGLTGAILDSTNVKAASGSLTGASGTVDGTAIAISDASASSYLRDAVAASTRSASNAALTRLVTTIALVSKESGSTSRPLLLTLGRDWENADESFARVADGLATHPWVGSTTLSDLIASTPTPVKIVDSPESASRLDRVRTMLTWEQREVTFSSVASDPEALTSSRRLALLSLLSVGWFDTNTSWPEAVDKFERSTKAIVNSVQVERSSRVLVLADQTSVNVTVSNNLDQPVTAFLSVRPTTPVITVETGHRYQSITIPADSQKRVQIPIQSLANGKAAITAALYDAQKKRISQTVKIQLNVQAAWETAGTAIFAVLVVGVFAFGIIRNIRRRRKANRAADEADGEADADTTAKAVDATDAADAADAKDAGDAE